MKWLILTTGNLPEAYMMARFLLKQTQDVSIYNIRGRTSAQNLAVLKRLRKRRGILYLADLLLGRRFRKRYINPDVKIFPEITDSVMTDIQARCQYHEIDDPHSEETLQLTQTIMPDYILFLGAPVIKPSLFSLAGHGALNWHHGISPQYRGSDCVLWAMANNDFGNIGFTIHYVSEVVDGGKIIHQKRVLVRRDLEFSEAVADVARHGIQGFIEVVGQIISEQELDAKEQVSGGQHYPPVGLSAIRRAYKNYGKYQKSC